MPRRGIKIIRKFKKARFVCIVFFEDAVAWFMREQHMSFSWHSSKSHCEASMLMAAGWMLWFLSGTAVFSQILSTTIRNTKHHSFNESAQRYLEEGADEDDRYTNGDGRMGVDLEHDSDWYHLDHWLDPTSLIYDIIEGSLYVADAFFVAWILWGCLVHCGICPDHRLNRKRRTRLVKDGRGVFAPLKDFDALASEIDDDDDKSRESMEYGDGHDDDDEYGDIDVRKEEEKIAKAAEEFFSKAEKKKKSLKNGKEKKRNGTYPEEGMLLDLEMSEQHHEKQGPGDVIFL
jgi:hypothetical protein